MATNVIKEITRDELKAMVREIIQEVLWEFEQQLPDPDEGLELSPEFAAILESAKQDKAKGNRKLVSHEEVKRRLGLDE